MKKTMIVRNLPYSQLNEIEQAVVRCHYREQIEDRQINYENMPYVNSVDEFWEIQREIDTEGINGELYDGWIVPTSMEAQR